MFYVNVADILKQRRPDTKKASGYYPRKSPADTDPLVENQAKESHQFIGTAITGLREDMPADGDIIWFWSGWALLFTTLCKFDWGDRD
ncbi:hypothetical protein PENSUB_4437 [Penicillium subrubescens]|uniref:Uncharacterized protein n=1 Tax=Penicillium subrubescens TaxID=1316194 RepID=A0A1Q5UCF0_9EURO|nr:hypothetical protein PENSUB_4438 [Penicillium subrubescens]OKP10153.1 hypothetical protein PENSUB_4437 [Penicillium subrubescens]